MTKKQNETYCCEKLSRILFPQRMIAYRAKYRDYGLFTSSEKNTVDILYFCPFCGKKFPPDLYDKYYEVLEELGVDFSDSKAPSDEWVESQIPVEFHSDEWWRSRGL
jgi:hypothetical protein